MAKAAIKQFIAALTIASTALFSNAASAQWIVFDPTNFTQTTVSAAQNVLSVVKQASQYATQLQQYQSQLMQLKNLPNAVLGDSITSVIGQISQVQGYVNQLTKLSGTIQGVKTDFTQRLSQAAALNLTYDQFMADRIASARTNGANAAGLFRSEVDNINNMIKTYDTVKQLQEKIPESEGMHGAMQLMNSQMNSLLSQTADMQQRAIQANMRTYENEAVKAANSEATTQYIYNFTQAQDALNKQNLGDTRTSAPKNIFK